MASHLLHGLLSQDLGPAHWKVRTLRMCILLNNLGFVLTVVELLILVTSKVIYLTIDRAKRDWQQNRP